VVPAVKTILGTQWTGPRLTFLVTVIVSVLPIAGVSAVRLSKKPSAPPAIRSLAANAIEDSTKTGAVGPAIAVKGYQENHGLKPTGTVDAKMWRLLDSDAGPLLLTYTITRADEKGPFQPIPDDTLEKAKMKWLGFETPEQGLGEKFHSSPKLLAELNPGLKMDAVGIRINVPNVRHMAGGLALRVVASKSKRTVIAYGAGGRVLAQFPATMGDTHMIRCRLEIGRSQALCIIPGLTIIRNFSGTQTRNKRARYCRPARETPSAPSGSDSRKTLWNPWDAGSGAYPARRISWVHPLDQLGCRSTVAHGSARNTSRSRGIALRLRGCISGLFSVLLAVGATSSVLDMSPPIRGLAVAELRDMFQEVHNGHPHEAIDILEPRGTPVLAVVSGTVRKLFLSKPGGNTIYEYDEMGVYCYYYAHLDGYAEGLREGVRVERGEIIGFVGSTGNADSGAPHLHFAIFELGPERLWWRGKAIDPYPGLVAAVKRFAGTR
jgi:murein DD-endopeptidase MepM/ murein hydrolase activator NlpD